jgi:hypothetical protein
MSKTTLFDPVVTTTSTSIKIAPPMIKPRTQMIDPNVHIATGGSITADVEVIGGS